MKWIYLVMSFFVKKFAGGNTAQSNPVEEFKELVKENAVKIFLAMAAAAFLGTLFVAGLSVTTVNLAAQYDQGQEVTLTAVTIVGLTLLVLSVIGFIAGYSFSTKHDRERKRFNTRKAKHQVNSVHDAILLLVNDYIAERQFKREQKMHGQYPGQMEYHPESEKFPRH